MAYQMAFSSILVGKHDLSISGGTPVRSRKILCAGLIAVVFVLAVHWAATERRLSARAEFVRASRGERPVEGRLSWGFTHAPYNAGPSIAREAQGRKNPPFRGGSESNEAESALALEAGEHDTPAALASRGILDLFHGRLNEAVRALERAVLLAPGDARLLSDLAAARLARSRQTDDFFDLVLALNAADRAVRVDPLSAEARFNLALALERLNLIDLARSAWREYLRLDDSSGWAGEARARVAALSGLSQGDGWPQLREILGGADEDLLTQAAASFPQELRQYADETLLGTWADAMSRGDGGKAARELDIARRISRVLARVRREFLPADAVATIDRAGGDPDRTSALVNGHRAYRDARAFYSQFRIAEAAPLFARARSGLGRPGSPVAELASLYLAGCDFQRRRLGPALEKLESVVANPANERYPGLLERAYWTTALVQAGKGDLASSLAAYRRALEFAARIGGAEDVAGLHASLAETWRLLGQPRESWRDLGQALALRPKIVNPRRVDAMLTETADACSDAGQWEVSRYFRDEAVRLAEQSGEPVTLAHALLRRSEVLHRLGNSPRAEADLQRARKIQEKIDPAMRLRIEADLLIAESEIRKNSDPSAAERDLTQALAFYHGPADHFFLSRLYLARARIRHTAGDADGAKQDLDQSIAEYELQRMHVSDEALQISYFQQSGSAFDDMIELLAEHADRRETAFEYAERGRARALLDRLGSLPGEVQERVLIKSAEPLSAREVRGGVPPGVALVEYAVLEDRLLAWVVREGAMESVATPLDSADLEAQVDRLRAAILAGEPLASTSGPLFDLLVRPVLPYARPGDRLVLVPDKSLHRVPFAALLDRRTGRYLAQDWTLSLAPSATVYLKALERDRQLESRQAPTILAVGNPTFDKRLVPSLPDLPSAESEARALVGLFPGSELLTGREATPEAFLAAASDHEIVHFAGHAMMNREFPLLSYLLMAPAGEADRGVLYVHELYGAHLAKTRLVVLAGCRTADGPAGNEGILSLSRGFLAAGIPSVVASLWDVDDSATAQFFASFYRRLRDQYDAPTALRHAQLEMLARRPASLPSTWAAFEILGTTRPSSNP